MLLHNRSKRGHRLRLAAPPDLHLSRQTSLNAGAGTPQSALASRRSHSRVVTLPQGGCMRSAYRTGVQRGQRYRDMGRSRNSPPAIAGWEFAQFHCRKGPCLRSVVRPYRTPVAAFLFRQEWRAAFCDAFENQQGSQTLRPKCRRARPWRHLHPARSRTSIAGRRSHVPGGRASG